MITLGNQIAIQFSIGDITDFIGIEDFHSFRIAENAGGLRPILNLDFQVNNPAVLPFLNTGNVITMMFGISEPTSNIMQFEIMGDGKNNEYRVGSNVSILAAMYRPTFTNTIKSDIFEKKKSYEALKILTERNGFEFVTNTDIKTNDLQTWYQSGIKDWTMSSYIAERAYLDSNTFFVYGFDNNHYYFYDIRKVLAQGPKWYLTVNNVGKDETDSIVNIGTYYCDESHVGQNAELAGKNDIVVGYNIDTGEMLQPQYQLKTLTTMQTDKINVNSTNCKTYSYMITTGDEHALSIEAQNQNTRNQILFSSYNCYVPVVGQYRDFRLFDCVQLIPAETDTQAEGIYFITGIAKEYKNHVYQTILTLDRESANGIQGENLKSGV